ncbi:MAG: hypothetical protein K940chlam9_00642 [Chlamydiae bacterium]|nr:hypothetical protein [Chlamydiota bacterium]
MTSFVLAQVPILRHKVGGMQEPGMLVSEDQNLGFLTDLGYTRMPQRLMP